MSHLKPLKVGAISDLHYTSQSAGKWKKLFEYASQYVDVLVICGDLTENGAPEEAAVLAQDLKDALQVPCLGVLGNHDYESDEAPEVQSILEKAGLQILNGTCVQIEHVGFAGICGFGGGFDSQMLQKWGEPLLKEFIREAIDHTQRLDRALSQLTCSTKVALLHYSPIRQTVEGECLEIFPLLGCSRLEEPVNAHRVALVLHGHAHDGTLEGKTSADIPVYNVALPLLQKSWNATVPLRIFSL